MDQVFVPVDRKGKVAYIPDHGLGRKVVLMFIILNLLLLDILFIRTFGSKTPETKVITKEAVDTRSASSGQACDDACLEEVKKTVATLTAQVVPSEEAVTTIATKEYFVPLGSGTNNTGDWVDVSGAAAYVDSSNYATIKEVIFEASIRIPDSSQFVYVRLYNVTDKHPVWLSEMSTSDPVKLLRSGAIRLDEGNKLYTVQMKTQLKATVLLDQARLKITTY